MRPSGQRTSRPLGRAGDVRHPERREGGPDMFQTGAERTKRKTHVDLPIALDLSSRDARERCSRDCDALLHLHVWVARFVERMEVMSD